MVSLLHRTDRLGLVSNVVAFTLLALISNGIIFALGWSLSSDSSELQPAWAVGVVWLMLLAALGAARWFIVVSLLLGYCYSPKYFL